jgi:hypothetical protein
MENLEQKKQAKRLRKMISNDNTLSKEDKDMILDAINKLCNDYIHRFSLRTLVHQVEIKLRNPEHIQAKRGFVGLIKLYGKRNEVVDIFNHLKR